MRTPDDHTPYQTVEDLRKIDFGGYFYGFSIIEEHKNEEMFRVHLVRESGKNSWQQGLSIDAFCRRELDDWYDNYYLRRKKRPRLFQVINDFESRNRFSSVLDKYDIDQDWTKDYVEKEIIHHETVWDFYKFIGYDHKKKKYLK